MAKKVTKATSPRSKARLYRKERIRKNLSGTKDCPRMSVFKSDKHIVVQLIDDEIGNTILQRSTLEKDLKGTKANIEGAKKVGKAVAELTLSKNIKKVVFDRNGYRYHGTIKALADAAREAGLVL